jgi:hypothetical protein
MDENVLRELAKSAKASLLVQLQSQVDPAIREKPEILLGRAGFTAREIADLLGKGQAAVAKTLQRAAKGA